MSITGFASDIMNLMVASYNGMEITMKKNNKNVNRNTNGSFLYLLPENVNAMQLHDALDYLNEKQLEVWTQINLLEVTIEEGTITFEDMMESLNQEDFKTLEKLGMKKVYAVDYALTDKLPLYKVMETLANKFGGKPGSDTEDFKPFINIKSL